MEHLERPSTRWETITGAAGEAVHRETWNKAEVVGQKAPFQRKNIWALRACLQMEGRVRERTLFNLGPAEHGQAEQVRRDRHRREGTDQFARRVHGRRSDGRAPRADRHRCGRWA
jgi:hypothetical protein